MGSGVRRAAVFLRGLRIGHCALVPSEPRNPEPLNPQSAAIPLLVLLASAHVVFAQAPAPAAASLRRASLQVVHYDARIEPQLGTTSVTGRVAVTLSRDLVRSESLTLDRGQLTIDAVERDRQALPFSVSPGKLQVALPAGTSARKPITIRYHGTPKFGLEFAPQTPAVYTIFSTSQWVPTEDAPSRRATWRLALAVPRDWSVFAVGRQVARQRVSPTQDVAEWQLDRPVPSYVVGFAAGILTAVTEKAGAVTLQYAAHGLTAEQLKTVFRESPAILDFFRTRAGVAYPGDRYSQVLVPETVGQEMAGLSLLSDEYGQEVMGDTQAVGLLAHEFAHQWWGNSVTNVDWTHFWLNEGFATFMAAAYREHRFGRDIYLKDIERIKARYERARDAGHDRALVFPNWDHPTADDRAIVYQKGGYVLHLLREALGDDLFWRGIAAYTKAHMGQSVTTADFKQSMQAATGRNLDAFFATWIEPQPADTSR